jgi:flagellar motor switch protein FliN/FliY
MAEENLELTDLNDESDSNNAENPENAEIDVPADIIPNQELPSSAKDLEAVYDIPVKVSAVLGKSTMEVNELLRLGRGAIIELDRKVGEAIDIYVNDRLVARGEVVFVEKRLGITMTENIKTEKAT